MFELTDSQLVELLNNNKLTIGDLPSDIIKEASMSTISDTMPVGKAFLDEMDILEDSLKAKYPEFMKLWKKN